MRRWGRLQRPTSCGAWTSPHPYWRNSRWVQGVSPASHLSMPSGASRVMGRSSTMPWQDRRVPPCVLAEANMNGCVHRFPLQVYAVCRRALALLRDAAAAHEWPLLRTAALRRSVALGSRRR